MSGKWHVVTWNEATANRKSDKTPEILNLLSYSPGLHKFIYKIIYLVERSLYKRFVHVTPILLRYTALIAPLSRICICPYHHNSTPSTPI